MKPNPVHTRLDVTTLSGLSSLLNPDFTHCGDWKDLLRRLATKGYSLRQTGGRLVLITQPHGVDICPTGRIGQPSWYLRRALGPFPT